MSITVFQIRACITCIASFFCTGTHLIMLLGINFRLFYSFLVPYCEDHLLSTNTLIRSFWPNIQTWMPLDNNHYTCNILLSILTKTCLFGQKSLIPIWWQTSHHKNSLIGSLSVFSWSNRSRSNLLNKFESVEGGKSALNKVEVDAICGTWYVWVNIGLAVLRLAFSTFRKKGSSIMGFTFFLASSPCVLEA